MACAIALVGICANGSFADEKPDISSLKAAPITVEAQPISTFSRGGPERALGKLQFLGGLVLKSSSPFFGGWSGLLLADDAKSFVALSDTGVWMTGDLTYSGARPTGIADAHLGPLLDRSGRPIARARGRDSESIALESGTLRQGSLLIGFEGRHRIERYDLTLNGITVDRGGLKIPAAAKKMRSNQGFEALTVLKGGPFKGHPIAFSERLYNLSRNHTGWLWTANGPHTIHLKNVGDFDVTDIASLDDGTLFVLERRFRWLEGVKMRLLRIAPDALGPDRTLDGETLIEADMNDNIDNMEGLAATRLKSGAVLITMISDDNFNHVIQRTLLLQFLLKDAGQAKARLPNQATGLE
ncbi:MAG: esterase-like activity of phytase family protein [Hyphomicrobium sp.]|uniref:esterase-like activity of phytase family protein n=1 Tax=Hyphomicrobium sp. TaxID=82 RepID=UPI0039E60655